MIPIRGVTDLLIYLPQKNQTDVVFAPYQDLLNEFDPPKFRHTNLSNVVCKVPRTS